MEGLRTQLRHLANFDTLGNASVPTLLLLGETGTGKGLVARVAHDSGPRAAGPFLAVNCAAIPETMLEAELFGFEAGAFTDARRPKPGLFEAASGGTLFLDEIDALTLPLQSKLLTAIETKQVRRLGSVNDRSVDVKLIAATNATLAATVAAGHFRSDLYIALRLWSSRCRHCASAGRKWLSWPRRFYSTMRQRMASHPENCILRPLTGSVLIHGQGTYANCTMSWSA
jgi:transcriptional regulator with PAS, ATPase and Fis domain